MFGNLEAVGPQLYRQYNTLILWG